MTIEVNRTDRDPSGDSDLAYCEVVTIDAIGKRRTYEIGVAPDTIDGKHILSGRRTDDHDHPPHLPDGPTDRVWDAAREHFRGRGWEVRG